ncbi:ABC transporter substrate-binding protein [Arsenicicoccus dermatophilus]|uniref:ABC transporter substrate-binding protein n=1 Tax=Arsenicicoccus dermatophilus TaxID=1076331 RepID=UPI001F4CC401|nr:ABC transporter substrate-binding protein [Arsenicicoccus dermatophilus]MCH8614136.1 ABC transporter substrate-binding protein [Arsenicicoccus dermatophilus]
MSTASRLLPPLVGALVLVLSSCHSGTTSTTSSAATGAGCITDFDPDKDYFPDKVTFEDAKNVTVEYQKSYKVVTVRKPAPGEPAQTYVLVQCGAPKPALKGEAASAQQITIPVAKVAASSTTQLPAYEILDRVDAVAGVGSTDRVSDGKIKSAIDRGAIKGFKNEDHGVSAESVAAVRPDLFVTMGTSDPANAKIKELGIPVVANAEWLESTALGRAEWMKYTALFLNAEKKADGVYAKIAADYRAVAARTRTVADRPTVLLGTMSKGTWYAAAADGYVANSVKDAGGQYVMSDVSGTGSKTLDLEVVLAKGTQARYWLNGTTLKEWKTTADIVRSDARLGQLAAVRQGNVWVATRRINAGGGNDYWQSGVVRPDLVLADLAAILHPELMPGHQFTYYEQVPTR